MPAISTRLSEKELKQMKELIGPKKVAVHLRELIQRDLEHRGENHEKISELVKILQAALKDLEDLKDTILENRYHVIRSNVALNEYARVRLMRSDLIQKFLADVDQEMKRIAGAKE